MIHKKDIRKALEDSQLPHLIRRLSNLEHRIETMFDELGASRELVVEALNKLGYHAYFIKGKFVLYKRGDTRIRKKQTGKRT